MAIVCHPEDATKELAVYDVNEILAAVTLAGGIVTHHRPSPVASQCIARDANKVRCGHGAQLYVVWWSHYGTHDRNKNC